LGRDAHPELTDEIISLWLRPSLVSSFNGRHVVNVWAGGHGFFACLRSSTLDLFAAGANSFGQLGHPSKQPIYVPVHIESMHLSNRILRIACGLQHTLILDSTGYVYGLGRSDDGRLGHLLGDIIRPQRIEHLANIIDITAGGAVSFAIDTHGRAYSFGMGDTCQTGHGNHDVFLPTWIESKQLQQRTIIEISVGAQHTLFLVKDKENNGVSQVKSSSQ
jgi:alpha-tubulin suppressor-like RCC1 family protein